LDEKSYCNSKHGCSLRSKFLLPSYQDDNIFEETTEKLIEYGTGVDIDLTPLSPESK